MGGIPVLALLASLALIADRMATGSGTGVGNSPNGYTPASLKVATLADPLKIYKLTIQKITKIKNGGWSTALFTCIYFYRWSKR